MPEIRDQQSGPPVVEAPVKSEKNQKLKSFDTSGKTEEVGPRDMGKGGPMVPLSDFRAEAERVILARYAPSGVIIDTDMEVHHFRGLTGAYLQLPSEEASLNLLKMARDDLRLELRHAVQAAVKDNAPVRRKGLMVKQQDGLRFVNLEIFPLSQSETTPKYFLVLFEEAAKLGAIPAAPEKRSSKGTSKGLNLEVEDLRQELIATKEYLEMAMEGHETSTEHLRSTNEKLMRANEELQIFNEELKTSEEELQTANEELAAVNEELEIRNQELTQANNDLHNFLNAVPIAVIILGPELTLRSFNPIAQKSFNLTPADHGRPLIPKMLDLNVPDLESLISEVLQDLTIKELEVQGRGGRWYSLGIRPYLTMAGKIDGVVLTLVDIDVLKQTLNHVEEARNYAEAIVGTLRAPLLVLDTDLRVVSANDAFYRFFKTRAAEIKNRRIYELGYRQWDIPVLRSQLETILPENSVLQDFPVEGDFPKIGHKIMLLNARRLQLESGGKNLILLAMEDITGRRKMEAALKESENKLRALNAELMTAQEYERRAVSLALHEEMAQNLVALKLRLRAIETNLTPGQEGCKEEMGQILQQLDLVVNEARELSRGLRPQVLDLGLTPAIKHLADIFSEYFQVDALLEVPDLDKLFSPESQVMIYRVLQETLVNVVKHARATRVEVAVRSLNAQVQFQVADNGSGFQPEQYIGVEVGKKIRSTRDKAWLVGGVPFLVADNGKGFRVANEVVSPESGKKMGLPVMEERIRLMGGSLNIKSEINQGTTISFIIPMERPRNQ